MLKNRWIRLLVIAVTTYVAMCVLMACVKDELIFPSRGVTEAQKLTPPADATVWWNETAPGVRTEAWFFVGKGRSAASPGPAVIYFHGNGEIIDYHKDTAAMFNALGISVLLVEYRGYGRSSGPVSISGNCVDAPVWFDRLVARPEVKKDQVFAYGFSLGAAFATQLATHRPLAGLVLESPFSSLPSMARQRNIYLYLSTERLDTGAALATLAPKFPILITHQKLDYAIPVAEGRKLAAVRPDAVYIEGAGGHSPLAMSEVNQTQLRKFLGGFLRSD